MFAQGSLYETSHWGARVGEGRGCRLTIPLSASSIRQGRHYCYLQLICLFNHDGLFWREPRGENTPLKCICSFTQVKG